MQKLPDIFPESNMKFAFMRKAFFPGAVIVGSFFEYVKTTGIASPFILLSGAVRTRFTAQFSTPPFSAGTLVESNGEPTTAFLEELRARYQRGSYDAIIGIGGGSVIDAAKALAQDTVTPLIVAPTTPSSGSETTPYALFTDAAAQKKTLIRSSALLPDAAVLDAVFLETIPRKEMGYFLFDILGHCIEGLASKMSTPFSDSIAREGIEAVSRAFPDLCEPYPRPALELIQSVGFLGGVVQGMASVGIAHSLAHYFAPLYGLSHARAVFHFLPAVVAANAARSPVYEKFSFSGGRGHEALENLFSQITAAFQLERKPLTVRRSFQKEEAIRAIQSDFCAPTNPVKFSEADFETVFSQTLAYED